MLRPMLVPLFILTGCVLARAADDTASYLTVVGEAEVQAAPDLAVLQLGVTAQADNAKAAQEQVNKLMQQVIDAVKKTGVSDENVQTTQLQLYSIYEDQRPRQGAEPRIIGYRASNTVRATVTDLSKVGPVIDAAIEAGANTLSSLQFELKNDQDARTRALQQAAQSAVQKARVLADAMHVTLGTPAEISESATLSAPPQPLMYGARAVGDETPVQPGQVAVHASVQIRYRVTTPN